MGEAVSRFSATAQAALGVRLVLAQQRQGELSCR